MRDDLFTKFERDGYVAIRGALAGDGLRACQEAHERLLAGSVAGDPGRSVYEATRIIEREPAFLALIDHPSLLPLLRTAIGRDVTLASAGEAYWNPAGAKAFTSWHGDFQWMVDVPHPRNNFWVRATWLLDDVDADTGPMTVLPGSHREARPCPADLTGPDGQPREIPGQVAFTGRAGDLFLNNTELWHTNTANRGTRPRKLAMLNFKHAWMRQWGDGHEVTPAFAEAQTDPIRRQLCNAGDWHRVDGRWPCDGIPSLRDSPAHPVGAGG